MNYLQYSNQHNLLYVKELNQLEQALQNGINQIKNDLQKTPSVEEVLLLVHRHLNLIDQQIQTHQKNEQQRISENNEKIFELQHKIIAIETGAKNMKNQLSAHQINVNQDLLTGLANQTAYNEYILGAYHRWQRGFGDTSVALADLDHFKDVNTKFGHQIGDDILKKIADIFKSSIRAADFVARYNGESFFFIFEKTSAFAADKVLETLRLAVEESEIYHQDMHINLTASFGLTAFKHEDTVESVVARVDEAMSQAKQTGRNRVVVL